MNKPKIRFKGFEGEWKEVKLSSIAIFSKGQGYSKSDLRENGHPIILYGRMYTKYQFAINEVDTFSNLKGAYVLSEGNEIIMPASGETPEDIACASAVLAKGIILGGDLNIVRFDLKKYSTPFLALTITYSKTHYDLSKCAQGKSVVHLHNEAISKTAVSIPSLPEQRALASYFTSLDAQIAASTSRLSSLKQIKAASLLNMFPQKGETVPRVRFKRFEGEWKEMQFGVAFEYQRNNSLSRAELSDEGIVANIHYGDVLIKYGECLNVSKDVLTYVKDEKIGMALYKKGALRNGDVIFADAAEDNTVGKCTEVICEENVCIVSGLHTIACRPQVEVVERYLGYSLNSPSFHNQLLPHIQGTKISSISKNALSSTSIFLPSLPEQRAIASYFTALDAQITLHRECLEKLKQIKAACLEKMFA